MDGDDEILAGCWIDPGSFDQWVNNEKDKNRGLLYLPNSPSSGGVQQTPDILDVERVTGDDLEGSAGFDLSSGVFGVKIDNVDGVGRPEIWCGDAAGHLYLFQWDGSDLQWKLAFRSEHQGGYVGAYDNIFPIKNESSGATEKLIVASSGYVMALDVDASQLP